MPAEGTEGEAFPAIEATYGENMLNLTCACGYLKKLLGNPRVLRFLTLNYREILAEFESLSASESL